MELRHGQIAFINEIRSNPGKFLGPDKSSSVRVLGTMIEVHVANSSATIEYKGSSLVVDTSLLGPFGYKINSLFQFIGELESREEDLVLKARVVRNVDGLDLALYEKSLEIRRRFEKKLEENRDNAHQ